MSEVYENERSLCNVLISVIQSLAVRKFVETTRTAQNLSTKSLLCSNMSKRVWHVTSRCVVINTFGGWRRVSSHNAKKAINLINYETEPDWAESDLRNSSRVGGVDVVSRRYVKTGHERSKSRKSRFTNIHTLLHSACYLQLAHKAVSLWACHSVLKKNLNKPLHCFQHGSNATGELNTP